MTPPTAEPTPPKTFVDLFAASLDDGRFVKAVLSKYRGGEAQLERLNLRRVLLRGTPQLQFVWRYQTRDVTKNLAPAEGLALLATLLQPQGFRNAHLHCSDAEHELTITQRGQARLLRRAVAESVAEPAADDHNRQKQRHLSLDRPFLVPLGVTTPQHQLIPAMARKWKQINKFVEVFAAALAASRRADAKTLRVVDFGAGKGYLTFALHDWLRGRGVEAHVTGVELRPELVRLCNQAVAELGLQGLDFHPGDVRHWQAEDRIDAMIALHACDVATDYAIEFGIRAGAEIIVCSPCCHQQIRPQLLSPHPLRPILQHGVHLGQEAEMLTDGLRALLLEACGYDTQVFEFVSLEHTNKNKMILAVRRAQPKPAEPVLAQIAEIKGFYGIREHCLETLLRADGRLG